MFYQKLPICKMMSHNPWFEHFKEQLQGLTESFQESGSSLSLLGYALKEQRLSSDKYSLWAMDFFKLPKLQSRFFTETPPSQEMFAKWATHYPWSAECLPVAEWDGSLIVACLQPPQDLPSTSTHITVLANYEDLERTWAHYQKSSEKATHSEAPEGIDLSASLGNSKSPGDSFSFDDLGISEEKSAENESEPLVLLEPEKSDAMEGLFDSPTSVRLESLSPQTPAAIPTEAPPIFLEEEAKTVIAKIEEEPTVAKQAPPPPPPQAKTAHSGDNEKSFNNKAIPLTPRASGVEKPIVSPVANSHFTLEKLKQKNASLINDKTKKVFSEMKTYFEKTIILTLDDDETQITAFAWDEKFQGISDTSMCFPLKTPSIFNIVAATQKPFHGYISLNEINEKFFESWNQGSIPDHVTISPLIINEKIVGMIMGFADKSAYNRTSLNLAEKLSAEFVKDLKAA